jgi:hypothetical protein
MVTTPVLYHQSIRYHNIVTMAKLGYAAPPAKPENRKYIAISESPIEEINVTHH